MNGTTTSAPGRERSAAIPDPGAMSAVRPDDLDAPELYSNRELSIIQFNERVLALAHDPSVPLLERVRYLTISCSNLDEFFEVRKASYQELVGTNAPGFDGRSTAELLRDIARQAHALVEEQYRTVNEVILPALAAAGIRVRRRADWSDGEVVWATRFFFEHVEPVLTPVALDPAHRRSSTSHSTSLSCCRATMRSAATPTSRSCRFRGRCRA